MYMFGTFFTSVSRAIMMTFDMQRLKDLSKNVYFYCKNPPTTWEKRFPSLAVHVFFHTFFQPLKIGTQSDCKDETSLNRRIFDRWAKK